MMTKKEIENAIKIRVEALNKRDKERLEIIQEILLLAWVLGGVEATKKILKKYNIRFLEEKKKRDK